MRRVDVSRGAAQPKCGVACSNRIWCGMGVEMEKKMCGIVSTWTQNGGEICKRGCDMSIKIKMTQNVCGMGCFLSKKTNGRQQYLQKVLELCGMGALSVTPLREKMCGSPNIVWNGG